MRTFKPAAGKQAKYRDSGKVTVASIVGERAFVAFPKVDGKVKYLWASLTDLSSVRGRPGK
jgi:hypothetical protein